MPVQVCGLLGPEGLRVREGCGVKVVLGVSHGSFEEKVSNSMAEVSNKWLSEMRNESWYLVICYIRLYLSPVVAHDG